MTLGPEAAARLIDGIYEAAVLPERWPGVLQQIADATGALGAMYMASLPGAARWIASPRVQQHLDDYVREGWANDTALAAPLFAEQFPGFRAEIDYRTAEEIARLPVHAEFMDPRGFIAGAGTFIQGSGDAALHISVEGFRSHDAARAALPFLDGLRPHLGRAFSLTALCTDRSRIVVDSLALAGVAAAVIGAEGRLRSANERFMVQMTNKMFEARLRLRFVDPFLQKQFEVALARHRSRPAQVQSIAVTGESNRRPFVLHLLPIKGAARDVCEADGVLILIADSVNKTIPNADLLRLLYDLTPAEARLARLLLEGLTLTEAAGKLHISHMTTRVQLRGVFAKTGVSRQVDLLRLLDGLGPPGDSNAADAG